MLITSMSAALPSPAGAVLNSPNAQIARSPDAALRRATPAFNADVKTVQKKLESVQAQMRIPQRKPWGGMANDVQKAQVRMTLSNADPAHSSIHTRATPLMTMTNHLLVSVCLCANLW